jgi:hypothetical protein
VTAPATARDIHTLDAWTADLDRRRYVPGAPSTAAATIGAAVVADADDCRTPVCDSANLSEPALPAVKAAHWTRKRSASDTIGDLVAKQRGSCRAG